LIYLKKAPKKFPENLEKIQPTFEIQKIPGILKVNTARTS
jgi:hypothetical protein